MTGVAAVVPFIDYLQIIGAAMLPVTELKGAILAYGLGSSIPIWTVFFLALLGSSIPVPFILLFIKAIIHWMQRSKIVFLNRFANWLMSKVEKHQEKLKKYGYWFIFVIDAIPVPGFGVYTGCLLAAMLDLKFKKSLVAILLGNVVAGIGILFITIGIDKLVH